MWYETWKVVHIFAVVAWMAGLFYLPRLFVYHVGQEIGSPTDLVFRVMERRLLALIMRPAAAVTLISGVALSVITWYLTEEWLWAKLLGVVGLLVFHGVLERHQAHFAGGVRTHTERYFRILNEAPTILLLWILIFVVFKFEFL